MTGVRGVTTRRVRLLPAALFAVVAATGCDSCGAGDVDANSGTDEADVATDADARPDDGPDVRDVADREDADATREDAADDAGSDDGAILPDCDLRPPDEVRPGASPGVSCRRISADRVEVMLVHFSGDGERVAFRGSTEPTWEGAAGAIWAVDRRAMCILAVDAATDLSDLDYTVAHPSVEQGLVAYQRSWFVDSDTAHCEIRVAELVGGRTRILDENESARVTGHAGGCSMNSVVLRHRWVVWRDVREADRYGWNVLAVNVETGEKRNLTANPPDGSLKWSATAVTLDGTTAFFGPGSWDARQQLYAADLSTGERWVQVEAPGGRRSPAVTPDWFVWIDDRSHPEPGEPRSSDVYGFDRRTGEEVALVVAGDSLQGSEVHGFGDWIAYEDQRDGSDVTGDWDREQSIYALHLPTRTEVRVTDWAGYQTTPRVYRRGDGSYGVLVAEEIDYGIGRNRLWDCDLPRVIVGGETP
jgi:hypothetical protein